MEGQQPVGLAAVVAPAMTHSCHECIDSHCHLDEFVREGILEGVIARARESGVSRVIAIGGSDESNETAIRAAAKYPSTVFATVGYDRELASSAPPLDRLRSTARQQGVVGIGETGLDYHYEPESAGAQKRLLLGMMELARDMRMPLVVHTRDADDDTHDMLSGHVASWPGDADRVGVVHCFTGSVAFARRLLDLGFHISLSGIVTFKNAGELRDVAKFLPLDRLLIETDAPYLAPAPHRGKRNEPSFVRHVLEAVAVCRGDEPGEIALQTARNTERLFGLPGRISG